MKAYSIILKHLDLLQPFYILEFKYSFKYCQFLSWKIIVQLAIVDL